MQRFLCLLSIFAFYQPSMGWWCPSEVCICISTNRVDCSNMHLRRVPLFSNSSTNNSDVYYDVVDLSLNSIRRLKQDSFRQLHSRAIRLSYNKVPLSMHRYAFRGIRDLQVLTITNSRLSDLPAQFAKFLNTLRVLDLSRNELASLKPAQFLGAMSLKSLDLSKNQLSNLQADIFEGLDALQHLILSFNAIVFTESKVFRELSNLQDLNISNNRIRDLQPDVFDSMPSLTKLDISDNYIPALFPAMLNGLSALQELDLSNNPIRTIAADSFLDLSNLRVLKMSKTKLQRLKSPVFNGLNSLQHLSITNGYLQDIEQEILASLPTLTHLNLDDNMLETLAACSVSHMFAMGKQSHARTISLTGNPIFCDCRMKWTALPGAPRVAGRCKMPPTVTGENITSWNKYVVCPHGSVRCKNTNEVQRIDEHPLWTYYMK